MNFFSAVMACVTRPSHRNCAYRRDCVVTLVPRNDGCIRLRNKWGIIPLVIGTFFSLITPLHAIEQSPKVFNEVGVVERIGQVVTENFIFQDSTGRTVNLQSVIQKSKVPIILTPIYYSCPMLCQLIADGVANGIVNANLKLGKDVNVISVSIDPEDTPSSAALFKAKYIANVGQGHNPEGWQFWVGNPDDVRRLTNQLGFYYKPDGAGEIAHQAALIILSPNGKIVRYLYGIEYSPKTLKLALKEARLEKGRPSIDQLILYCYKYDSASRSYTLQAMNVMRLGGIVTVIGLIGFIFWLKKVRKKRVGS